MSQVSLKAKLIALWVQPTALVILDAIMVKLAVQEVVVGGVWQQVLVLRVH